MTDQKSIKNIQEYMRNRLEEYRNRVTQLSHSNQAYLTIAVFADENDFNISSQDNVWITPYESSPPICKLVHNDDKGEVICNEFHLKLARQALREEGTIRKSCPFGVSFMAARVLKIEEKIRGVILISFGRGKGAHNIGLKTIREGFSTEKTLINETTLKEAIKKTPIIDPEKLKPIEELIFYGSTMLIDNAYKSFEIECKDKDLERRNLELDIVEIIEQRHSEGNSDVLNKIAKRSAAYFSGVSCSIFLVKDEKLVLAASSILPQKQIGKLFYKKGHGLTGWLWEHKRSLIINDVNDVNELAKISPQLRRSKKSVKFAENLEKDKAIEIRRFLGAPLFIKNKVIGVIRMILTDESKRFSEEDRHSIEKFALHISHAIDKKLRYEKLNKLIHEFSSMKRDLKEVLVKTVEIISDVLMSERCSLFLLNPDKKQLLLQEHKGTVNEAYYNLDDKESLVVNIYHSQKCKMLQRYTNKEYSNGKIIEENEYWSLLGVPIKIEDRAIGVIKVMNKRFSPDEAYYSDDDKTWLEILACDLANIIENHNNLREIKDLKADAVITESLTSIGLLASGMAHRFGNYIATLRGVLANMNKNLNNAEIMEEKSAEMGKKFDDMSSILDELINFPKNKAGGDSLIDINEAIDTTLNQLEYDLKNNDIKVIRNFETNMLPLKLNIGRMQEVFINLIINAVDAMPGGGKLKVSTQYLGDTVQLEFRDTGEGVPKKIQGDIFKPFYTTKEARFGTEKKGTGIGLFLCQKIIKEYGGTIDIYSEEGKGARFTITIPASQSGFVFKGDAELFKRFYEKMQKDPDEHSYSLSGKEKEIIKNHLRESLDQADEMVNEFFESSAKTLSEPLEIAKEVLDKKFFLIKEKFDTKKLPELYHNEDIINEVVNEVYERTGKRIFFTIFQVTFEESTAIRIATNVPDAEGRNAYDTRISGPVYETVIKKGLDYHGRAWVVVDYYLSVYKKVIDKDDPTNIPIILYVGLREDKELLDSLSEELKSIDIFRDGGYINILTSKGIVVVHPNLYAGFDLSKDDIFSKREDETLLQYYWKNPGENEYEEKVCLTRHFPDWKWIISATAPLAAYKEKFLS